MSRDSVHIQHLGHEVLAATLLLLLLSVFKLFSGEIGDFLYVIAIFSTCLLISISRNAREFLDIKLRKVFRKVPDLMFIQVYLLIIIYCLAWPSLNLTLKTLMQKIRTDNISSQIGQNVIQIALEFARSSTFLVLLFTILILLKPKFFLRVIEVSEVKTKRMIIILGATIIFLIQYLKTPASLPDYFHTVFAGDEILANQAGLTNYSDYIGQYSNILTKLGSLIPFQLQNSREYTDWFLIFLQLLNVLLVFYITIRVSNNFELSCFFAIVVLASPFFGGSGTLDWLQNIPSRTLLPTIVLLFFILLVDKLKLIYGLAFLLFISLSFYNDVLTGIQLIVSLLAVMLFCVKKIGIDFRLLVGFVIVFIGTAPLLYAVIKSDIPLNLLLTYLTSYGESGFAREFDFLGPDIYIWGFALGSIFHSLRVLDTHGVERFRENSIVLFASYLILSTIPYCAGRSFRAQIWASSAIYLIILFSATIRKYDIGFKISRQNVNIQSTDLLRAPNFVFCIILTISICTGFWKPSNSIVDIERIVNGSNDVRVVFASQIDPYKYEQDFLGLVKEIRLNVPNESIGLLVPRGNLLSIRYRIKNNLVVNHPDSLILKGQIRALCLHLGGEEKKVFITDKTLAIRMRQVSECKELFQISPTEESARGFVVALYTNGEG